MNWLRLADQSLSHISIFMYFGDFVVISVIWLLLCLLKLIHYPILNFIVIYLLMNLFIETQWLQVSPLLHLCYPLLHFNPQPMQPSVDFLVLTTMVSRRIEEEGVVGVNLATITHSIMDNPSVVEEIIPLGSSSPVATIGNNPVIPLSTSGLGNKSSVSFVTYLVTLHSNALSLRNMETKHHPISPLALHQVRILP